MTKARVDENVELVVHANGRMLRLGTPEKWRRAVINGDIRRDTLVDVEAAGLVIVSDRAENVQQLKTLLDEHDPKPSAPTEPPEDEAALGDDPPPQDETASAIAAPPPASEAALIAVPAASKPPSKPGPPAATKAPDNVVATGASAPRWAWIAAAAVAVGLILWLAAPKGDKAGTGEQTYYVTRETMVREQPSSIGNAPLTSLARGDRVRGDQVMGGSDKMTPWLRIARGEPHADRYVWMANLSRDPRPHAIEVFVSPRLQLARTSDAIRERPNVNAADIRTVSPGDRIPVLARTSNGWFEVGLSGGGVGYVPSGMFDDASLASPPPPEPVSQPALSASAPAPEPAPPPPAPARASREMIPPRIVEPPRQQASPGRRLRGVRWVRRPNVADRRRHAPQSAADAGVQGRVVIDCVLTASGTLTACRVAEESPSGWGFGAAALALSTAYQADPLTRDGSPVAGGVVSIPIRFGGGLGRER